MELDKGTTGIEVGTVEMKETISGFLQVSTSVMVWTDREREPKTVFSFFPFFLF